MAQSHAEREGKMNLDDCKVFVFVRQDLPIEQQLVQVTHATFHMAQKFGAKCGENAGIPFHVLIGLPDGKALLRVEKKLLSNNLSYYPMWDTDVSDVFPTAIATFPLQKNEANLLRSYRLWRFIPGAEQPAGLNAEPGANAALAQSPLAVRWE